VCPKHCIEGSFWSTTQFNPTRYRHSWRATAATHVGCSCAPADLSRSCIVLWQVLLCWPRKSKGSATVVMSLTEVKGLRFRKVSAVARLQRRGTEGVAAAAAGQQLRQRCCSESSTRQAAGGACGVAAATLQFGFLCMATQVVFSQLPRLKCLPTRSQIPSALGVTRACSARLRGFKAHVPEGRAGRPPYTTFSPALGSARNLHSFSFSRCKHQQPRLFWLISCSSSLPFTGGGPDRPLGHGGECCGQGECVRLVIQGAWRPTSHTRAHPCNKLCLLKRLKGCSGWHSLAFWVGLPSSPCDYSHYPAVHQHSLFLWGDPLLPSSICMARLSPTPYSECYLFENCCGLLACWLLGVITPRSLSPGFS
jgi:hypothetical protein